jgi:hypothetical protein
MPVPRDDCRMFTAGFVQRTVIFRVYKFKCGPGMSLKSPEFFTSLKNRATDIMHGAFNELELSVFCGVENIARKQCCLFKSSLPPFACIFKKFVWYADQYRAQIFTIFLNVRYFNFQNVKSHHEMLTCIPTVCSV